MAKWFASFPARRTITAVLHTGRCEALIARMRADNPLLITDLRRTKNYI